MKYLATLLTFLLCLLAFDQCHAETFFEMEAGIGGQVSRDMGDGVWYQQALPHSENMSSPAYMLGVTGTLQESGRWRVDYHVDYVYFGEMAASCMCVPDVNYNPRTHQTVGQLPRLIPFSGHGHVQLLSMTISPSYTMDGFRFGLEAGPTIYWNTWHETAYLPGGVVNASHKTRPQAGWTAGLNVSRGNFTLAYRYYYIRQQWNPYPGIVTGTHMLMLQYRF